MNELAAHDGFLFLFLFFFCMMNQGNLKGELAMVAILLSRMEVNYCTSGFFHC